MQRGQPLGLIEKLTYELEENIFTRCEIKTRNEHSQTQYLFKKTKERLGWLANPLLAYLWVCDLRCQAAAHPCFVKGWKQVLPVQPGNYRTLICLKSGSGLHPLAS